MPQGRTIRVLVVDDSLVMRSLLRMVLGTEPRITVAGSASDGESALRAIDQLHPDLVMMDIEMPGLDGLETLRRIRALNRRLPVIMCSTLTRRGASVTIEALSLGASDYVTKPDSATSREEAMRQLGSQLIPKVLALAANYNDVAPKPEPQKFSPLAPRPAVTVEQAPPRQGGFAQPRVVVIGISTGGPAALDVMMPELPANFPVPILLVQHMPQLFTRLLAERLDQRCKLRVTEAVDGEAILPGHVYVAPGDYHLEAAGSAGRSPVVRITQGPPENHCRPAADVLFRTAVQVYGRSVLGVVMTGMGSDGTLGSKAIRAAGGAVLAQNQETCAVWGMPGSVAKAGLADKILPLNGIAAEITRIATTPEIARAEVTGIDSGALRPRELAG